MGRTVRDDVEVNALSALPADSSTSPDAKRFKSSSCLSSETDDGMTAADTSSSSAVTPCSCATTLVASSAVAASTSSSSSRQSSLSPNLRLSQQQVDSLLWKEAEYSSSARLSSSIGADGAAATSATAPRILKRTNYLSWDDYFLAVATLSAKRSKDPKTPTGACLVDARNRIVGIGYNGFPRHCSDDLLPWTTTDSAVAVTDKGDFATSRPSASSSSLLSPSLFVVHAELNAILNKCSADVAGCRLYCQDFPCHDCAKIIIQSRIQQVVYCNGGSTCGSCHDVGNCNKQESLRASRVMLTMAGVEMIQIRPTRPVIELVLKDASKVAIGENEVLDAGDDEAITDKSSISATTTMNESHRQLLMREANYDPLLHPSTRRPESQVLSWDDYFTSMAVLTAQRSKDPNTQVGACLVDDQKRIIGLGYNGFPSGCSDDDLPWARTATNSLHCKYPYVCHAEVNAILNKGSADVRGATLYVALFPCNECAKVIVQAGICEVVYMNDYYHDTDACRASRIMFQMAGVKLRRHVPIVKSIRLELGGGSSNDDRDGEG